jgi:hypothetical protein
MCINAPELPQQQLPRENLSHDIDGFKIASPGEVAIPKLEEENPPTFTAPDNWLQSICEEIVLWKQQEDTAAVRVPPLCLARCSRGGKTRSLYEIAKFLKEQWKDTAVVYVTFNAWSEIQEWEQHDPVGALFRRIAFAALKGRSYKDSVKQYRYMKNQEVSKAWIEKWLGEQPCVLLIDELNKVKNLERPDSNSESLAKVLKDMFLTEKGRYFVFSSHLATTGDRLAEYMESTSAREVLKRALPLIPSLQAARVNLKNVDLRVQEVYFYGLVPALIYTSNISKGDGPPSKAEEAMNGWVNRGLNDHDIILLFQTFVDGNKKKVPQELMPLMDVTDNGDVRWILFQIGQVLKTLTSLSSNEKVSKGLRSNLLAMDSLIAAFKDAKTESGEAWESLFVLVLLIRCLTGQGHEIMGAAGIAFTPAPVTFSRGNEKTVIDLLDRINKEKPESGPQISLYYPHHAKFPLYDCVLVAWDEDGNRTSTIGYQLKQGNSGAKDSPSEDMTESYVIKGSPNKKDGTNNGWVVPSGDTLNAFFGESGKQWTPEKWKEIESAGVNDNESAGVKKRKMKGSL